MDEQQKEDVAAPLKIGDRVKIRNYAGNVGRIVELRGALGPGGALIYRVLVRRKPVRSYIELRGDQLQIAPDSGKVRPAGRTKPDPETR